MNFLRIGLLILISVGYLAGCVQNQAYRNTASVDEPCKYTSMNTCPTAAITVAKASNKYHLAFIEYDDQGFLHNPKQKNDVMDFFRKRVNEDSEKEVLMMTYIHGWHHNARGDVEDSDIIEFRTLLQQAANTYKNKEVLGLYIGWRGRVIETPLDNVTFYSRKDTAHEIGQNGITEELLELEQIVKGFPVTKNKNLMITIGHSFGGAALFSSIREVLSQRLIQTRAFGSSSEAAGFGDLVVLLNPAFEGLRYQSIFELSQDGCRSYPDSQLPKLVTLSTPSDFPVRHMFTWGRYPVTMLESHRSPKSTECKHVGDKESSYTVNQWAGDRIALGHFKPYMTHILRKTARPQTEFEAFFGVASNIFSEEVSELKEAPQAFDKTADAWISKMKAKDTTLLFGKNLILSSEGKTLPFNPYMNIFTQDDIMDGHNGIWTPEVKSFVQELVQITATKSVK